MILWVMVLFLKKATLFFYWLVYHETKLGPVARLHPLAFIALVPCVRVVDDNLVDVKRPEFAIANSHNMTVHHMNSTNNIQKKPNDTLSLVFP